MRKHSYHTRQKKKKKVTQTDRQAKNTMKIKYTKKTTFKNKQTKRDAKKPDKH